MTREVAQGTWMLAEWASALHGMTWIVWDDGDMFPKGVRLVNDVGDVEAVAAKSAVGHSAMGP